MTRLDTILSTIVTKSVKGTTSIDITGISFDSRRISVGDLFVAVRGTVTDGHRFIDKAVEKGARAVVCEETPGSVDANVCYIEVGNSALALSLLSQAFYNNPSTRLKLVGVTGTNGKTTIATLLYDLFISLGYKAGVISTVGNRIFKKSVAATHTTPDPIQLNMLLDAMVNEGCDYAFMEVSSIALDQFRTYGLQFSGAVFTNLTHDHLDYHGNFDNYLSAKKGIFDHLDSGSFALINSDDSHGKVMVQNCRAGISSYAMKGVADFKCRIIEERFEGMMLRIEGRDVSTRFIGDFNAYNLLAVYGTAIKLGAESIEVLTAISNLTPVEGRLEVIRAKEGKTAIVDYAHTPDALENVLGAINRIKTDEMSLITVVGAGGDRDNTKRPVMGKIAVAGSDTVILTSDNPRSEDPDKIIGEMAAGISDRGSAKVLRVTNRREAIKTALMLAGNNDIVLVAGKGHETYQEVKGVKSHFDDREEIRKFLN